MSSTAEIVIIGGGIVGTSVAYHLAQKGYTDILILEKKQLGSGSTGKSSGVLRQFYTNKTVVDMARVGIQYYANFYEMTGVHADFTRTGYILAGNESNRTVLEKGLEIQKELGINSRILTKEEILELDPRLKLTNVTMGFYEVDAGYADPPAAALGFASYARKHGATLRQGVEVLDIKKDAQGVNAVVTDQGIIETRTVINCGGPWAKKIGNMVGIHFPVETSRHQVVTVRRSAENRKIHPVFSDPINLVYIRPEGDELTLIGSNHPDDSKELVEPDKCPEYASMDKVVDMLERSAERMPFLLDEETSGSWSGIYTISPDGFPILEKSKEVPGFYTACGLSGHGFKLAPAIGQIMSSLVTDSQPDLRAHMFRLSRYAEGEAIDSVTTSALSTMKH
jgi:sarcosine oxidase subunit beta